MNPNNTTLTRRMALGAIAGTALLTALPAMAQSQLVDVRIINRDNGEILPFYRHQGELWIAGEPGARYAVELYNRSRRRLLNVVSVDAPDKVQALQSLMTRRGLTRVLYAGDDASDEQVFRQHQDPDWFTLRVGGDARLSAATFHLNATSDMPMFLAACQRRCLRSQ